MILWFSTDLSTGFVDKRTALILQIALDTPLRRVFDYLPPVVPVASGGAEVRDTPRPGVRVRVSFGRQRRIGILVGVSGESAVSPLKLKAALEILDDEPIFDPATFDLLSWAAEYYHHPIGEVFAAALPARLRAGQPALPRTSADSAAAPMDSRPSDVALTEAQARCVDSILAAMPGYAAHLLYGVTGSGKTEVYLRVIAAAIAAGGQALVLVPEIALTPQLVDRFRRRFSSGVVAMHSGLTGNERRDAWRAAHSGRAPGVA